MFNVLLVFWLTEENKEIWWYLIVKQVNDQGRQLDSPVH